MVLIHPIHWVNKKGRGLTRTHMIPNRFLVFTRRDYNFSLVDNIVLFNSFMDSPIIGSQRVITTTGSSEVPTQKERTSQY